MVKQVKGSIFKSVARGIRSDKNGIYDDLISDEAKDLISRRILSTTWYPFEIYKNCLNAVAQAGVKGNMEIVKHWGYDYFDELLPTVFKEGIIGEEIKKVMEKYKRFVGMVYNFGEIIIEHRSENEIIVTYKDFDPDFEVLYQIIRGLTEKFVGSAIGKKISSTYLEKSWEGAQYTVLKLIL